MTGFYISIYNGLLQGKHRQKMGAAVWEFMWLIDKVTSISEQGIGTVLGGKPIKLAEIAEQMNVSERTISTNLNKLQDQGYITMKNTGHGYVIKLNKAKKKFQKKEKTDKKTSSDQNGISLPTRSEDNLQSLYIDNTGDKTGDKIDKSIGGKPPDDKALIVKEYGNTDINEVQKFFLEVFQIPKEDCTQKQSRQYWNLLLKESKKGIEGVKWLIIAASKDDFYRNHITSSKDLYYKRVKVITRQRMEKPKIAVMPQKL